VETWGEEGESAVRTLMSPPFSFCFCSFPPLLRIDIKTTSMGDIDIVGDMVAGVGGVSGGVPCCEGEVQSTPL
jgi:hypothetical protein